MSGSLLALIRGTTAARPLGIARAGVGIAAFLKGVYLVLELPLLVKPGFVQLPVFGRLPTLDPTRAMLLLGIWLLAALALALGWRSRTAATLLALSAAGVLVSDLRFYSNHLFFLAILGFLLAFSRCGDAVSLDARAAGREAASVPLWPVFLLQLQLTLVYLFGGISKINPSFLRGEPIAADFRRTMLRWVFADRGSTMLLAISVIVILLEVFLAIGLWRPKWRPLVFSCGFVLHASILMVFGPALELLLFGIASLSLYLLFLEPSRMRMDVAMPEGRPNLAAWIERLDWLNVLDVRTTDEPGMRVRLRGDKGDGCWSTGRAAAANILASLPVTIWVAPLFSWRLTAEAAQGRPH